MKKYLLVLFVFLSFSSVAFAAYDTSNVFCASGFGASSANGTYTYYGIWGGSTEYSYSNGNGWYMASPSNSETNYGQLQSRNTNQGQCYGNAGNGLVGSWSFDGASCGSIAGVAPGGTTVAGACGGGGGGTASSTYYVGTTTAVLYNDWVLAETIKIILLAFIPISMLFNPFRLRSK